MKHNATIWILFQIPVNCATDTCRVWDGKKISGLREFYRILFTFMYLDYTI